MRRLFTSRSVFRTSLVAVAMTFAQSAWAEYVKLTALSGTGDTGGSEGYPSLVDANESTKMGHSFDPNGAEDRNKAYIVVKAEKAVVPEWYFLVTGGDTGTYFDRNWKSWKIFGGNFASDADAKRDTDDPAKGGWTLIDEKSNASLPQANTASMNFQFSDTDHKTAYQYFWIEITESVNGGDTWLQMAEWGLGTHDEFTKYLEDLANVQTGTDEPVIYTIIDGDRNNSDGEGLAKLFDGDINTKWGNGFSAKQYGATSGGAFFIVKTSRAITPSYYKLVTGTDNASWNHRNWKNWQIYGIAAADVQNGKPGRASDKWVLLDNKANVSEDVLPDKNCFTVMFSLSEENTTAYQYFKVEIDEVQSGSGYMQMSEFSLGDEYTLPIDRQAILDGITFNPDAFAEKALLDEMAGTIVSVEACTDPFELGDLNAKVDDLKSKISASAANYAELDAARNQAITLINDDNLNAEALAYATAWISETDAIAPSNEYPAGNFAYIKANRQLTGQEASAEAKRFSAYLLSNVNVVDDPIYATYEAISGSGGFNNEGHAMLIDGDRDNTKWCSNSFPGWMIFKADDPIKPTYYGLVTGGDTDSFKDRNWKSWKIYAANFDSDAEATPESDKWVLIDEKNNVGTDVLKTTNKYESYISLSIGCAEPYQYFMLKDVYAWGGLMQMNEFTFYNQGNLAEKREEQISEFEDFVVDDSLAYAGYITEYNEKFAAYEKASTPFDLMRCYNELKEAMEKVKASRKKYLTYQESFEEVSNLSFDSESLSNWFEGYSGTNEGPCNQFIRGTYEYIMESASLDNDEMDAEIAYLNNMVTVAQEDSVYILLGGHTEGEWRNGFYGHLININKQGKKENGDPSDTGEVKWGGEANANGNTYIIFRTTNPVNPYFYTLTTGADTQAYYGRNWGTWRIYGANFEGDGAATKDAEGWVLIDEKENVGQNRLHPVNAQPSYFGFSTRTTTEYLYYKIEVLKAYEGNAIQMNSLHFGTEEEFDEIKQGYVNAANEFEYDVRAEQRLIDEYVEQIESIDEVYNMEELFSINEKFEHLRDSITASKTAYDAFETQVEGIKTTFAENNLDDSEAKTILELYLEDDQEPSETYPNGTFAYILDNHVLADSVLTQEVVFVEQLLQNAVNAGFGLGADVTALITNPTFANAGETLKDENDQNIGRVAEGWNGYIFRSGTNGDKTMAAAEFCNENSKFNVSQTVTGLKNGYYKMTVNAGFRANGNLLSFNYAAMAYANDVQTYIPVIREDAVADSADAWMGNIADKMIYAEDSVENFGIGIWGCEGTAHAATQGRYLVPLVAKVTDGTLTIGLKNEGTTNGGDWTGATNFRLIYLGEDETAEIVAQAFEEVAEYNAARIETMQTSYVAEDPYESQNYQTAPNFYAEYLNTLVEKVSQQSYEAEKEVGQLMQSVLESKKAYLNLKRAVDKVSEKWFEYAGNDDANEDVYSLRDGLEAGSIADADAEKDALYAKWPAYLQKRNPGAATVKDVPDTDPFTYEISTTGVNPSVELYGFYEALTSDEMILAFEYKAPQPIERGAFLYQTPNLQAFNDSIPTLPAAEEWTPVYFDLSEGISTVKFGTAENHGIRWNITTVAKGTTIDLNVRNFRVITKAEMEARGGSPINSKGIQGDVNNDSHVDIADVVSVLNIMAKSGTPDEEPAADVNGDGHIDIADVVSVLNIMAAQ